MVDIKKEIESLIYIKNFGNITKHKTCVSSTNRLRMPFYPPPSFSYAFLPSTKKVKIDSRIRAVIILNESEIEYGYVKGLRKVIFPSQFSSRFVTDNFAPPGDERFLCSVAISKKSKKVEKLRRSLNGNEYIVKFKIPHQVKKITLLK